MGSAGVRAALAGPVRWRRGDRLGVPGWPASVPALAARRRRGGRVLRGSTFVHVRNTRAKSPRANAMGDQIVFTNRLGDTSGSVIGKLHVSCTTTVGARNFSKSTLVCEGVAVLRDGALTLQATTRPGIRTTTGAVTGGTGAYANARGVFVSRAGQGGAQTTITLAG